MALELLPMATPPMTDALLLLVEPTVAALPMATASPTARVFSPIAILL